jgi:mono/diheme cytochrome c family protein
MRFRNYFALVLLVSLQGTGAWSSPELDKGKKLYAQHCAECHGIVEKEWRMNSPSL